MKKGDIYNIPFTVDEKIYKGFVDVFNDHNPLHTDKDFAINYGFNSIVMHGNILNGFLSRFIGECLPIKSVMIISQVINYMKPVYLNDKLALIAEIVDYFDSVRIFEFKFYFENQFKEKIAKGKISIQLL